MGPGSPPVRASPRSTARCCAGHGRPVPGSRRSSPSAPRQVVVAKGLRQPLRELVVVLGQLALVVDSVHDHASERELRLHQLAMEANGLGDRLALGVRRRPGSTSRGSPAARSPALARSRKPSSIPLKAWKNSDRSSSTSTPVIRRRTENIIEVPRPKTRIPKPVGCMKTCSARPSMNCISRLGASEEVERVAGRRRVEHQQVVAVLAWSSKSFSIAMYSCEPARAAESCW